MWSAPAAAAVSYITSRLLRPLAPPAVPRPSIRPSIRSTSAWVRPHVTTLLPPLNAAVGLLSWMHSSYSTLTRYAARCAPVAAAGVHYGRPLQFSSSFSTSPPSECAAVLLSGYSSSPSSLSTVAVSTAPTPSSLLPRCVLLRVLAVSVNPLDVMSACGYGRSVLSLSPSQSSGPVLGRDAVGVVERVGSAVWRYRVGDRLWVSRDPLAGGTFAQFVAVDVRECSVAPRSLPATVAACYPFAATTVWTALVHVAGVRPVSFQHWRGQAGSGGDSGSSAGRALIHGAAGPVGLLTCQLLRAWGFTVTATCKRSHDISQLARFAHQIVYTDAEERERERKANSSGASSSTAPGWLSVLADLGSYSLFVDCVGGVSSESAALSALSSPGGHFVSLRGALLPLLDSDGLWSGGLNSAARLADRKAVFGARGLRYDWVVNRCDSKALRYFSAAIDRGLLECTQPERIMRGIDSVPAAMQMYGSKQLQGKVVVELEHDVSGDQEAAHGV